MNNSRLWIASILTGLLVLAACAAPAPATTTAAPVKQPTTAPTVVATTVPAVSTATTTSAAATVTPAASPSAAVATPTAAASPAALSGKDLAASKFCARCHGVNGEGGFGPVLAGNQATQAQAVAQVRSPRNRMPKFSDKQVSDAEIGAIVDYYKSQPKPATAGVYPYTAQPSDPPAKVLFTAKGCAACHGIPPNVSGTKLSAAEEITQVRTPRARMGAFSPAQVSDAEVTTINEWLRSLPGPTPAATAAPSPTR